jgi:hypothetical protein
MVLLFGGKIKFCNLFCNYWFYLLNILNRNIGVTLPTIPILWFYECGPGGRSREKKSLEEKGRETSIFDTVWPPFENNNWKTWIGLFVN